MQKAKSQFTDCLMYLDMMGGRASEQLESDFLLDVPTWDVENQPTSIKYQELSGWKPYL